MKRRNEMAYHILKVGGMVKYQTGNIGQPSISLLTFCGKSNSSVPFFPSLTHNF